MAEKRVNYSEISSSCESLTSLSTSFRDTIDTIEGTISKIKNPTWDGYAANNYVEAIKKLSNHLPDANKQLAEAVLFLASCADGYKSMDKKSFEALKEIIGGQDYIDNYDVNNATTVDLKSRLKREDVLIIKEEKNTTTTTDNDNKYNNNDNDNDNNSWIDLITSPTVVPTPKTPSQEVEVLDETPVKSSEDEIKKRKIPEEVNEKEIPSDVEQEEQKTKIYDKDSFKEGSKEEYIYKLWETQESRDNNSLAILKIDDEDYYLVKTSPSYGKVGDIITIKLEDNTTIKCIIAEHQEQVDNYNEFGLITDSGKTQIVEFERKQEIAKEISVEENTHILDWDSKKTIKSIINNGEIVGVLKSDKTKIVSSMAVDKETSKIRENMISVASKEIGNTVETKYVEMFGEKNGTAWCSEFVSWCAEKNGYVADEIVPKFADAPTGVEWFKSHELFQNKGYTPNTGDIIFVGTNEPSHTALVERVENDVIYTIEGNVNDVVKRNTRHIGDANIYGYGTPNYSELVMKTIE